MYKFNFEKLEVWKKSKSFTKSVYEISNSFPEDERFGLISQLRRSAVSVCSNLAEGSSRLSAKDQKHFYNMAYSSLMESFNQILISYDLGFMSEENLELSRNEVHIISLMINNLRKSTN
ncbi:MAG: four helix bundle protein [Bacteroidales bacterium]|nr:four helix bundle protein [Bacteroidales bacterium]